ncbi:hypothetical protein ACFQ1L_11840 [Phytohabitans flavus]|uniref:hypothetical protein n=1 Tax=Phytohabitans flavus TaxID=1076124 RepID=UPI0036312E1A
MTKQWGPAERAQYLADLDARAIGAPATGTMFTAVTEAERLVAACERDWDEATAALGAARANAGPDADLAHSRHLAPADRARLVGVYQAEETWRLAGEAYDRARARLNAELARLGDLARPDLGLPPGPQW